MSETSGKGPAFTVRWDDEVANRWLEVEAQLDAALGPVGEAALALAAPRAGEKVVDIGCGGGASTVALADAVGQGGRVLAIDIAAPMLARAKERAGARSQISCVEADAATFAFTPDHDLIFSRFGVMFFEDPPAAFANLGRALHPGGRLCFVCWRTFAENPWLGLPFATMRELVPGPSQPPLDGPGPFAFADADRTRGLLGGAGFQAIAIDPIDLPITLGPDVRAAVRLATHTGPTGRVLATLDEDTRRSVRARLAEKLATHERPGGVFLPGAAWLVSARR